MTQLDQAALNRFCAMISQGMVTSDDSQNPVFELSSIALFPQEDMDWIGTVTVPIPAFDPKTLNYKNNISNARLGISDHRMVLASPDKKIRFRSFWWEITTDGKIFQDGKLRYMGIIMEPPFFRTGMLQRDIVIKINTIPAEGKPVKLKEFLIFDFHWKDPATGKLIAKKGQVISDLMMEKYNQRKPLQVLQLWEWVSTGKVESIKKSVPPQEKIILEVAEEAASKKDSPRKIEKDAKGKEGLAEASKTGLVCPGCGKPVEQNWKHCPFCGAAIRRICSKCGKNLESGWVACPYCGMKTS